ncbi:MAG: hypothetical protein M5R41_06320 [Bacteroidia bacterium]|nr:hypothetical protein [Bacteroidia bacterium]
MAIETEHYQIPADLDIDMLLHDHPPSSIRNFDREKLISILGILSDRLLIEDDLEDSKGFVPLNVEVLQSLSIHNPTQYLQYLVDNDVVVRGRPPVRRVRSTEYMYHHRFANSPFKKVEAIRRRQSSSIQKYSRMNGVERHPFLWRSIRGVTIDEGAATRWLELSYLTHPDYATSTYLQSLHHQDMQSIGYLRDEIGIFLVGEYGCRLNTPITNMRKGLRGFLRYEGIHFEEIDLSNSQLSLFLAISNTDFIRGNSEFSFRKLAPSIYAQFVNVDALKSVLSAAKRFRKSGELESFQSKVQGGTLYQFLVDELRERKRVYTIEELKKKVFKALYSSTTTTSIVKSLFEESYPSLMQLLDSYKQFDHAHLSHILQRAEAFIVLDKTVGQIAEAFPDAVLLTVHDALLTTPDRVADVDRILKSVFEQYVGFPPTTKQHSTKEISEAPLVIKVKDMDSVSRRRSKLYGGVRILLLHNNVVFQPICLPDGEVFVPVYYHGVETGKRFLRVICSESLPRRRACKVCADLRKTFGRGYRVSEITGMKYMKTYLLPAITKIGHRQTSCYVPFSANAFDALLITAQSEDVFDPVNHTVIEYKTRIKQTPVIQISTQPYDQAGYGSDELIKALEVKLHAIQTIASISEIPDTKAYRHDLDAVQLEVAKRKVMDSLERFRRRGSQTSHLKRENS